jgi:hypothetical protein
MSGKLDPLPARSVGQAESVAEFEGVVAVVATEFEQGVLVGLLVGEGHFGGDGRQPHITLRMHVRHEALFRWIERTFPGGRLYGPYEHGGRHYYQWMARGPYLRDELVPMLRRRLGPRLDGYASHRFEAMLTRFRRQLGSSGDGHSSAITDRPPVEALRSQTGHGSTDDRT